MCFTTQFKYFLELIPKTIGYKTGKKRKKKIKKGGSKVPVYDIFFFLQNEQHGGRSSEDLIFVKIRHSREKFLFHSAKSFYSELS